MVRSWVESRRRGREDALSSLATTSPAGAEAPATVTPLHPTQTVQRPGVQLNRALALVSVIRGIGSPLQSAVSEVASGLRERGETVSAVDEARAYAQLVQQVVSIGRTTASSLEIGRNAIARWNGEPLRWAVLEALSDVAGAHFRAAGLLQPSALVSQIAASVTQIAIDGARREDFMPGLGQATLARLGLDLLKAMPPVVHAVTRFSFGRNPLVLITEIAWELQYKAVECTRRLLTTGSTLDEWHSVYGAFVTSAGQLYAEAHFAEAERMARLNPAERKDVGNGEWPMAGVWDAFDHKLNLLTSFAGYMTVPDESAASNSGVPAVRAPF